MKVLTQRNFVNYTSRAVVYEWEDIFCEICKFDLQYISSPRKNFWIRLLGKFNIKKPLVFRQNSEIKLFFAMNVEELRYICWMKDNVIPIMLDVPREDTKELMFFTKNLPIFFVTALDTEKIIKKEYHNTNVEYIPLSVSDIYKLENIPDKCFDVIQLGRRNGVLHEYMMRYCEKYPTVEYLYQEKTKEGKIYYVSTKRGNIGSFENRKSFIDLLKKAKVSLVSTPSIDNSRSFGIGIDFFTPRWYESAINYCYLLGRYSENEEAKLLKIESICKNVRDYKTFEALLSSFLNTKTFLLKDEYNAFIESNVTSKRAQLIQSIMRRWM